MDRVRIDIYKHLLGKLIRRNPFGSEIRNIIKYYYNLFRGKTSVSHFPISIVLYINKECNLNCSFCYNKEILNKPELKNSQMSHQELISILDSNFGKHALRIALMGGEPFLHPNIFSFIELCSRRNKIVNIVTNAMPLKGKKLELLIHSKLDVLGISLYRQNCDDVKRVVKQLNNHNKNYWVQTVADATDLDALERNIRFCISIDCRNFIISNYNPCFDGKYDRVIYEDNEEYKLLQKKLTSEVYNMNIQWVKVLKREKNVVVTKKCRLPFNYVHIDNKGVLGPCCFRYPDVNEYGGIFTKQHWNGDFFIRLRENMLNGDNPFDTCKECENLYDDLYGI